MSPTGPNSGVTDLNKSLLSCMPSVMPKQLSGTTEIRENISWMGKLEHQILSYKARMGFLEEAPGNQTEGGVVIK